MLVAVRLVCLVIGALLTFTALGMHAATAANTPPLPSPYLLPWPGGIGYQVEQGNNGKMSHTGMEAYAWDFAMPSGSLILAAREGRISFVESKFNVGGPDYKKYVADGNYIAIDHGDGTTAVYLHLMHDGAIVKPGDHVSRGQPIGYSGQTGFSSGPHLHFQVERTDSQSWFSQSLPVAFADVATDKGVPLEGKSYISGNTHVQGVALSRAAGPLATTGTGGVAMPDANYLTDLTVPDGSQVYERESLLKRWRISNPGPLPWPGNVVLRKVAGADFAGPASVPVTPAAPGAAADVTLQVRAPLAIGMQESVWQLSDPSGNTFGDRLWLRVQVVGPPPTLATSQQADGLYFGQTGHNVSGSFARFYASHGGLDVFGYPRTESFDEGGMTVQYFQRARFESHPEQAGTPFDVQLTLLGDQMTADQRPFAKGQPFTSKSEHRYYGQTGHGVHFAFLRFFDSHGGLDNFGYPTSEELVETTALGSHTVQYFQRARFEYHPEHAGTPYEVQLGLLGDDALTQRGWLPVPAGVVTSHVADTVPAKSTQAAPVVPLSATAQPAPATASVPAARVTASGQSVIVNTAGLRIRSQPDPNASIIGMAYQDDRLNIVGQSANGYLNVQLPGGDGVGWVDSQYTKAA